MLQPRYSLENLSFIQWSVYGVSFLLVLLLGRISTGRRASVFGLLAVLAALQSIADLVFARISYAAKFAAAFTDLPLNYDGMFATACILLLLRLASAAAAARI